MAENARDILERMIGYAQCRWRTALAYFDTEMTSIDKTKLDPPNAQSIDLQEVFSGKES